MNTLYEAFDSLTGPRKYPGACIRKELPNLSTIDQTLILTAYLAHNQDDFLDNLIEVFSESTDLLSRVIRGKFTGIASLTLNGKLFEKCEPQLQQLFKAWLQEKYEEESDGCEFAEEARIDRVNRARDMQAAISQGAVA